jgi:DNA-binding MarR family transcriptional regulator
MTTPLQAQEQRPTRGDAPMSGADAALDRVLRVFERGQHSATEMRVLLRLIDHRDASISELAEQLGCRPTEITRAGRRLAMRGLVRTHRGGSREQTLMEITPSGLATVETLRAAARPSLDSAAKHRGPTVEEMGECSFPVSDPPAVWTWEVSDSAVAPTEERAGEDGPIHPYPNRAAESTIKT